ncbi:hypothetical protein EIN_390310 [Entamoeba invadens IP1]|uniref:Uncharacterized protein n=1 Tax=Entamoeba invadens IP1 TaxID=370355 RepID=A0A0A1UB44_ENTIV|nr:hypothetical protein EIN_390310 [Entamoeba invadens IP1]ELP89416.1 hypothetical protein EIN_390310 [Entamoeba invadens IP1]|eukprot:XP_004256187.1 hypothetical protein EIN_390310 [Entamoeba invadens IP1]
MGVWEFKYPLLSGLAGSLGGFFSKGITSPNIPMSHNWVGYLIRALCLILMFLSNASGGFFFAKALSELPSLVATITSTLTGFVLSGLIGNILGEEIRLQWYLGMIVVICGVTLLLVDNNEKEDFDKKKVEHEKHDNALRSKSE